MKPFLLIAADFIKTGGMDRANYALADYIVRQGAEVHLVSHRVEPELQRSVIWHRVPKVANSNFLGEFLLDQVGRHWAQKISQRGGRVLVNGGNCDWADVNWVHYVHAAYQPESKVNRLQRTKIAITHAYFRRTEQRNLQQAQVVIANSERTQSDLIKHNLTAQSKVVYYGTDPETFYPATTEEVRSLRQQLNLSDCPIAVFIGALSDRRKGFDVLFEAWKHLCQDSAWNVQLLVIGQGAEVPIWKQRFIEAGFVDRIQFLGFRSDVPNLLRASDCLIAPTRYEAYGLGVHEALCCGIPAIVTKTAGVAERYPSECQNLLLSNAENVDELVQKLSDWNRHQTHYRSLIRSQVTPVLRRVTWDDMAQQILNAIEDRVLLLI